MVYYITIKPSPHAKKFNTWAFTDKDSVVWCIEKILPSLTYGTYTITQEDIVKNQEPIDRFTNRILDIGEQNSLRISLGIMKKEEPTFNQLKRVSYWGTNMEKTWDVSKISEEEWEKLRDEWKM
jgi:hypothetical protein